MSESSTGADGTGPRRDSLEQLDSRWGLGEMLAIAFFCACCWLLIGLLLVGALMLGGGNWLTPSLIAAALVGGLAAGLFPTMLYRRDAKLAESAFRALAAEAPDQVLIDARARDPRLLPRSGTDRRLRGEGLDQSKLQ